jgi:site-specific recombinase XerD
VVDVHGRLPTLVPRDDRERRVIGVWRRGGLTDGTIAVYLSSIRRFRHHCRKASVDEIERLTYADVAAYAKAYIGPRRGRRVKHWSRHTARSAMHAWSCALQILGVPVPPWRSAPESRRWPALVNAYGEYRRSHRGIAVGTLLRDMELASGFLGSLRSRSRSVAAISVKDIDDFVDELSARLARRTVAGLCSSLRCFLRFLRATGRIRRDLWRCVVAPRYRVDERPPRALPWESVRRILRAIPRDRGVGRRDYAMFLLMAAYGLGAGEIVGLRLDDIDWRAGVLRARRPKTAVPIELPLLPAVARALASYLRGGRSRTTSTRAFFVTAGLPHRALTTSVLRRQTREYAARAGIAVAPLGSHVFRHSHATRQIDAGAPAKIVGDILGHRRPSSMSVYVRLALRRLRSVGLPVPR